MSTDTAPNDPPADPAPRRRAQPESSRSVIVRLAEKFGVDAEKLYGTLKATAFKQPAKKNRGEWEAQEVSNEQMMALLVVADQYDLNPFTRELYAFPDKSKGIVPIVSLDGWVRIINKHPDFDGCTFTYPPETEWLPATEDRPACPAWVETTIFHKGRSKPWIVREYLDECYRPPFKYDDGGIQRGPWQTHPKRFLRHKSLIQCGRLAFGFAGIYDPDEAERIAESMAFEASRKPATPAAAAKEGLRRAAAALEAPGSNTEQALNDQVLKTAVNAVKEEAVEKAGAALAQSAAKARELIREPEPAGAQPQRQTEPKKADLFEEGDALTEADFIPALRGATDKARLDTVWGVVLDHYDKIGKEVPLDVEDAYQLRKENL